MLEIKKTQKEKMEDWLNAYIQRVEHYKFNKDIYNLSDSVTADMRTIHVNNARRIARILKKAVSTKMHDDEFNRVYFMFNGYEVVSLVSRPKKK